jgi:glycosyltransferase 2 family protein
VTLLYLFFRSVDVGAMATLLADVALLPLLPAIGVYFVGLWLRALRWKRLVAPFADVRTTRLFRVIIVGFAVNNVLPLRLGELVRMFLLRHSNGVPAAATLASILLERALDVVTLCGLMVVVSLFVPLDGWLAGVAGVSWIVVVGAAVGMAGVLLAPRSLLRWALELAVELADRFSRRLARLVRSFLGGVGAVGTVGAMAEVGALSMACWVAELGLYYFVMRAFSFDSGVLGLVAGMVAANLATIVPSSPGYVGTFDLPLQSALSDTFGVPSTLAGSYTLLTHALLLVPVVVLGLLVLSREDLSLRALGRGRVAARSERSPAEAAPVGALPEERGRWV